MVKFREHFRDLAGWKESGLHFGTTSNEAVKLYDIALDQLVYYYNHPVHGGLFSTLLKMREADPDFLPGELLIISLKLFVTDNPEARGEFDRLCERFPIEEQHPWHQSHMRAAKCLYKEDLKGAVKVYAEISRKWPGDLHGFNLGYILGLVTGMSRYMRDIPLSVISHYNKPGTPHYGLIHGKLCFGYAEMGEYAEAEKAGRKALEIFPLDSWALHAMAHTYENMVAPEKVVSVIEEFEPYWTRGVNFTHHIHWHKAGAHVQLGQHDTALGIYDSEIVTQARGGDSFPLSDASSLLMRITADGVGTGGREKELVPLWSQHKNTFTSLFYDGHIAFTSALAGDVEGVGDLARNMEGYIGNKSRSGWNKDATEQFGADLMAGCQEMARGDYDKAVSALARSVPGLVKVIHGSKAQKSVFSVLLAHCAVVSGCGVEEAMEHLEWVRRDNKPRREETALSRLLIPQLIVTWG
eukprot:sb/3464424/